MNYFSIFFQALTSQHTDLTSEQYQRYVNFSTMWAFAGTLEERYRSAFGYWWRAKWQEDLDFPQEGEVNVACELTGEEWRLIWYRWAGRVTEWMDMRELGLAEFEILEKEIF